MDEIEQLRQWKAEAMPVLDGLQELGKELGIPLGKRITGPDALEAARKLKTERDALRTGVEALADEWEALVTPNTSDHDAKARIYRISGKREAADALRAILAWSQAPQAPAEQKGAHDAAGCDAWSCPVHGEANRDAAETRWFAKQIAGKGAICGYNVGDTAACRCLLPRGHKDTLHKCKHKLGVDDREALVKEVMSEGERLLKEYHPTLYRELMEEEDGHSEA